MIVVVGKLALSEAGDAVAADGLAAEIARAAASAGARVELISKVGDDPAGDAALLALAQAGVGHVATLRDPARLTPVRARPDEPVDPADLELDEADTDMADTDDTADATDGDRAETAGGDAPTDTEPGQEAAHPALEAADVALALRYLADFGVLVAVHGAPELLSEAVSAARWTGARLVVVVESDGEVPPGLPADALVVAARADDAEGVGARIGRYAAALSRGDDSAAAYRDLTAAPTA